MNELDTVPCYYIGRRLQWLGIRVTDTKEKYGEWRVYCDFGIHSIHDITHNGYAYIQYKGLAEWLYFRTVKAQYLLCDRLVNWWLVPLQRKWYRKVYHMALRRFPTEAKALLMGADWGELLLGLDSRYTREKKGDITHVGWKK
jgi:hypothetical protein